MLMVGGGAVNFHGTSVIPRMWILIETTDENFKKLVAVF
jgi:hypothetical protein